MFYNMLRRVSFVGKKRKSSTKNRTQKTRCFFNSFRRLHAVDDDFAVGVFVLGNARKFATDVVEFYHGVNKALGIYDLVCKQVYCRIEFPIAVFDGGNVELFFQHVAEVQLQIAQKVIVADDRDRAAFLRDAGNVVGEHVGAGFVQGEFRKFAACDFDNTLADVRFGRIYGVIMPRFSARDNFVSSTSMTIGTSW